MQGTSLHSSSSSSSRHSRRHSSRRHSSPRQAPALALLLARPGRKAAAGALQTTPAACASRGPSRSRQASLVQGHISVCLLRKLCDRWLGSEQCPAALSGAGFGLLPEQSAATLPWPLPCCRQVLQPDERCRQGPGLSDARHAAAARSRSPVTKRLNPWQRQRQRQASSILRKRHRPESLPPHTPPAGCTVN